MKKIIFATILSLPMFLSAGQYVGIHGGPDYGYQTNASNSGQKVGYQIGAVYGYDIAPQFRAEAEVSYRDAQKRKVYTEKGTDQLLSKKYESKHSWSYMINVAYDIVHLETLSMVPFVGMGIGFGNNVAEYKIKYDDHVDSEKRRDSDFAWQAVVGVSYKLADGITSRVKYTYHRGQQHSINHGVTAAIVKAF